MYSFDFWSAFFADGFLFFIQLLTFSAIFSQVNTINGWNMNQVAIFIGTFTIIDGTIMATTFFGIISLPEKIRSGELDLYIVKPINTLFYVSFDSFNPASFMVSLMGVIIVCYGVIQEGIQMTAPLLIGYIILLFLMYLLMYALMIMIRLPAFWLVKVSGLLSIENEIIEFAFRVPGVVYKGIAKFVFWVVIPYGLIATIPTQFISDGLSLSYWLLAIGITVAFLSMSILGFKKGLMHYSSASS